MKSMTGFGSSNFQVQGISSQVTVRTVNGRYLEVRTHLPKELQILEPDLKSLAKKSFLRGTVDISLQFSSSENLSKINVGYDEVVAKAWVKQVKEMKSKLKLDGDLDVKTLLALPGVTVTAKTSKLTGQEKAFLSGATKAFDQCVSHRKKEGLALKKLILGHLSQLEKLCKKISQEQKKLEKKLSKELKDVVQHEVTAEGRALLEVKTSDTLEKINVEEELSRLGEHIKSVKALCQVGGPSGRKMDFFAQEFLREMNTVGSKSGSSQITSLVVEGKSAIESFREQVQNIE
ncbi:MAG TPA: YicC family protein [Bdellovibrionales bacterium]|nr:YicC family protein [Pseudobdellovibrionaceae bacterium]HAG91809.1 YicC family protein [Bdellovibrionales bacterium]|tara:strand:+ start:22586 stop:23455 length:870 start_codon:yes stop_codon:yes gene_type:complete